jgi:carotenoid cleavage dioxygenase
MTLEMDAPKTEAKLPFHMRGNYAPVQDEIESFDLKVEGRIPDSLDGVYLRNGPNPPAAKGVTGHWFMGDGMLHGLRLGGGLAHWYRNRWVKTKALAGAKMRDEFGNTDRTVAAANTHVVPHGKSIYALVESSFPTRVSPDLETLGTWNFGGKLDSAFTAHPHICPETGEMHAFGYDWKAPLLVYFVIDKDGNYIQREEIAVTGPTMIHDFALTRHHAIFMDLPVVFDVERAMAGTMPYAFSDDYPARLGILERGRPATETRWVSVKPNYTFHVSNAYEEPDGTIVVDVARYEELWRTGSKKNFDPAFMHRWTIRPGATEAIETPLDNRAVEFPRIDERLTGLPYRYAYAPMNPDETAERELDFSQLARYDLKTGQRTHRDFGPQAMMSEFVHTPKHADAAEDDGWLMGFVYDKARNSSDFWVLDAATLETQARVILPRRVPQGFHGSWCPGF